MKKTTVYLPDDLKSTLGRVAAQKGWSEAELIQRGDQGSGTGLRTALSAGAALLQWCPDARGGLVDASVVVLANRHDTRDVLTLDELHFRLLPADAGRL
jgi:hypothetical protein